MHGLPHDKEAMSTIHREGRLRGDKILYKDGISCCIWIPIDEDENSGICFDFDAEDLDDMIRLLERLKEATPDVYQEQ